MWVKFLSNWRQYKAGDVVEMLPIHAAAPVGGGWAIETKKPKAKPKPKAKKK